MKKILLLLMFIFSIFLSCEKNDIVTVVYAETRCANAWERGETNAETIYNIEVYLQSESINPEEIWISARLSNGPFCDLCNCWYGRLIYAKINYSDFEKIKKLGFKLDI